MRLGLITGDHPRHVQFCNQVVKHVKPVGHVIVKREAMLPTPPEDLNPNLLGLWHLHFDKRDKAEAKYFNNESLKSTGRACIVKQGNLNNDIVLNFVRSLKLDMLLIAGVDVIKPPLLDVLPPWTINLHMGLPPYRGTITPFWAMYFFCPHWIGCTYHTIQAAVDTGQIIHQVVPDLSYGDGLHDVATKAYMKACADVGLVLKYTEDMLSSATLPVPDESLASKGKLFYKKDWRPEMLRVLYELYNDNIVDHYLNGLLSGSKNPNLTQLRIPTTS